MDILTKGLIVVVIVMGLTIGYLKYDNLNKGVQIAKLETELVVCSTNNETLKNAITDQNTKVEALRVDYESSVAKYNELAQKPESVRFEKVFVKVPTIQVKSNECDDIKKLLDEISKEWY